MSNEPNGWNEWSKFVLKELERLNSCYERLNAKMDDVSKDIVMLKVKSGVWGAIGGVCTIALAIGLWFLRGLIEK